MRLATELNMLFGDNYIPNFKWFMLSRTKTECLECKFNSIIHEVNMKVRLDAQLIPPKGCLKYLGSFIQGNGEIDDYVTHRIGVG